MLVVTKPERLKEFGFEKCGTNYAGRDVWSLTVHQNDNEDVYLCVNPLKTQGEGGENENEVEIVLGVSIERDNILKELKDIHSWGYDREFTVPLDVIFDMIQAGVLVKREAVA